MANASRSLAASLVARARNRWGADAVSAPVGQGGVVTIRPPGHAPVQVQTTAGRGDFSLDQMRSIERKLVAAGLNGPTATHAQAASSSEAQSSLAEDEFIVQLRAWIKAERLTQGAAGDLLGVSQNTISRWLREGLPTKSITLEGEAMNQITRAKAQLHELMQPVRPADPDTRSLLARVPTMHAPERRGPAAPVTLHDVQEFLAGLAAENHRLYQEVQMLRAGTNGLSPKEIDRLKWKAGRYDQLVALGVVAARPPEGE